MQAALAEYESTVQMLIQEQAKMKPVVTEETLKLREENKRLRADLSASQSNFSSLSAKCDELRQNTEQLRADETKLKQASEKAQKDRENAEAKFKQLKSHAEEKLNSANACIRLFIRILFSSSYLRIY